MRQDRGDAVAQHLAPAEAEIEAVRHQQREPVARIVAEQLRHRGGARARAVRRPSQWRAAAPCLRSRSLAPGLRSIAATDAASAAARVGAAQHERAGTQAVAGGERRIAREVRARS